MLPGSTDLINIDRNDKLSLRWAMLSYPDYCSTCRGLGVFYFSPPLPWWDTSFNARAAPGWTKCESDYMRVHTI